MYSSSYSKYSPEAKKRMQYRSKAKSCGYYMRIVFFFSSLIQSLIIVSLVLFLIYGKKQDSASTSRIQDLEESFSRLSIENVALREQRKNLTNLLNTTMTNKARNDWDLARLRSFANISLVIIQDLEKRMQQCSGELLMCRSATRFSGMCPPLRGDCNCGPLTEQLKARLELVDSNFTQTTQRMRMEMDQTAKERDTINLEVIRLRRDKSTHEKEVDFFRQKCKDDFALSLSGVSNVSKAFLEKIDSLFPTHIAFQLTCPKQREHLEQIRTNCSSLSREVEDKFQRYLDIVGQQVSSIQAENSRLKAENWRLSEDYRWCGQNRTGLIQQHRQTLDKLQRKHDEDKERLLMDKMRLNGDIEVLVNTVKYKSKVAEHLTEQLKKLNMSCISTIGPGGYPGGPTFRGGTQTQTGLGFFGGNQPSRTGTGGLSSVFNKPVSTGAGSSLFPSGSGSSTGLGFNKPVSTGAGSSLFPSGSGSSTGLGFNKPVSTGAGSSLFPSGSGSSTGLGYNKPVSTGAGSSNFPSGSGSSTGLGFNKPVSTGGAFSSYGSAGSNPSLSSSGTGSNKPALSGRGSSTIGSSSGSVGSSPNLSSSGTDSNKPTSSVKSSSGLGSSSGSTGSTSKSGSSNSGFSWLGFGSSNSGQSKTGSGTGKGTSSGNSYGGTGSSLGAGRTSGLGGGQVSVAQHIQDLQRIINPAVPEEKQDLSRMLG